MKRLLRQLFVMFCLIFSAGYVLAQKGGTTEISTWEHPKVERDPYGRNPLCALISFSTAEPAQVQVTIKGRDGAANIQHTFEGYRTEHQIPVLGLYENYDNVVTLKAIFQEALKEQVKEVHIPIGEIGWRAYFSVQQKNDYKTKYHYMTNGLVYDEDGYLRLAFSDGNVAYYLNGEIVSENRLSGLVRYSLIGEELQRYPYPKGFTSFTHGIGQKPNGNFLILGSFVGTMAKIDGEDRPSHNDFVIEMDYHTGEVLNKIDLAEIMNPQHGIIISKNIMEFGLNDWCHINGVDYDPADEGIIVSCRHSGIIKVNEKTHELVWIISPNKEFDRSGRDGLGKDISDKVLVALDSHGVPYKKEIQEGMYSGEMFKWPIFNHNPKIYPNNLLAVYDNSGSVYNKDVYSTQHSNALIYLIDEQKKTVQQFWREELNVQSDAGSSVLYHPDEKEVIVYSSNILKEGSTWDTYGQLTRYDFDTHRILFSATIYRGYGIYFYRSSDFQFYPDKKER